MVGESCVQGLSPTLLQLATLHYYQATCMGHASLQSKDQLSQLITATNKEPSLPPPAYLLPLYLRSTRIDPTDMGHALLQYEYFRT